MQIGGYKVQSGSAVVYMTRHAQRDPEVFEDPETFDPNRWNNKYVLKSFSFVACHLHKVIKFFITFALFLSSQNKFSLKMEVYIYVIEKIVNIISIAVEFLASFFFIGNEFHSIKAKARGVHLHYICLIFANAQCERILTPLWSYTFFYSW